MIPGIHGRNDTVWQEADFQIVKAARLGAVKLLSLTGPGVFDRLKRDDPDIVLITRLYDSRIAQDTHPTPAEFAARMIPQIKAVEPYCNLFEIHNEPNHLQRIEGWGQEDHHAQDFNNWFLRVYDRLKEACPWASFGFPGLAIPHRDLEWIEICRPAVERADWLGVHCYWQTPPGQERNHLADFWGLRFKYYHQKFPDKTIHITECGNSNNQASPPIPTSEDELARQVVEYYQECARYPYLGAACFFILSSPDPTWSFFTWRTEDERWKPVVQAVAQMKRLPEKPAAPQVSRRETASTESAAARLRRIAGELMEIAKRLEGN